jgi:hypothetical protein
VRVSPFILVSILRPEALKAMRGIHDVDRSVTQHTAAGLTKIK